MKPSLSCLVLCVAVLAHLSQAAEIHDASAAGNVAKLRELLGANNTLAGQADTNGITPLHFAARAGHVEAVTLLLEAGADLNALNRDGHPPLYCALHNGRVDTAKFLLGRGATFDQPDYYGALSLHQAVRGGKPELIEMLLAKGMPVDSPAHTNSFTALHEAAREGRTNLISLLLRRGADINRTSREGWTPLHAAAVGGQFGSVKTLLEAGANPDARDRAGFKPLDLVQGKENDSLARYLQDRTTTAWQESRRGSVGEAGDPALLELHGNTIYTSSAIREALAGSVSYLLAAHPQSERIPLLEVLRQRIVAGYRRGGFPQAKVEAAYDERSGRIRVEIDEGPRFLCGTISLEGFPRKIRAQLQNRLTKWQPRTASIESLAAEPLSSTGLTAEGSDGDLQFRAELRANTRTPSSGGQPPPWLKGKPANFDPSGAGFIERVARQCLLQEGLLFPKLTVAIEPDPRTGTASLTIVLKEPGPVGTIADVELTGNTINSRAEILKFLGLRSGQKMTADLLLQLDQKLWASGRFVSWKILSQPARGPENSRSGIRLRLELDENDRALPLRDKLSREASAFLKCADWIRGFENNKDDLVLVYASSNPEDVLADGRLVISPKDGALLEFSPNRLPLGKCGVLFAKGTLGLFLETRNRKFQVEDPNLLTMAFLKTEPTPAGSSNRWNFTMGGSFQRIPNLAEEGGVTPPFQLHLSVPPAALFATATDLGSKPEFLGNTLLLRSLDDTNSVLRINEKTGKFDVKTSKDGMTIEVHFETGAFARERKKLEGACAASENGYIPNHPFSSLAGFIASQMAYTMPITSRATNATAPQRERAAVVLHQLLGTEILAPLDRGGLAVNRSEQFELPMDDLEAALARNSLVAMFSGLAFKYSNEMFPKYSWPWTIAREAVFVMAGQPKYTDPEINRLYASQETGPIGSLVIAHLLGGLNPQGTRTFALRGITRLAPEDFLNDCNLFLRGNSGLARSFANLAEKLRATPEPDVEALASILNPAEARLVTESAKALREQPGKPLANVLAPALERYWRDSLRARVRSELQRLTAGTRDREPSRL